MQHGGRDNDWRHRAWTMPETMRRMCKAEQAGSHLHGAPDLPPDGSLKHCITDWKPINDFVDSVRADANSDIEEVIEGHIMRGRLLYAALVDAGIPWQDARRVLFMGMQTYIHDQYNYLALSGVLANRLEHIMDWEFNCVAQLMLREIKMKCPPLLSKYLGSHSDRAKAAKFAALQSWPPDRKYPSPYDDCVTCGHAASNHFAYDGAHDPSLKIHPDEVICHVCENDALYADSAEIAYGIENYPRVAPLHRFVPKDRLERQHRPEQMPFFVLHPDSMAGGPIVWIPTNGQYPHDKVK
jgi:hypothetical protein